jgi:hypothetical protein
MMSGGVGGGSGSSTSLSRQYQQQGSLLSPTLSTGSEHHPHHPYASSPQPIATHRFQRPSFLYPAPPSSSSSSASSSNIIFPHLHHPNQARLQAQTRPDRSYSLSSSLPTHTASYWNQLAQPPVPPVVSQRQNLVFNPNIPTLYEAFPPSFSSLAPPSPAPLSFSTPTPSPSSSIDGSLPNSISLPAPSLNRRPALSPRVNIIPRSTADPRLRTPLRQRMPTSLQGSVTRTTRCTSRMSRTPTKRGSRRKSARRCSLLGEGEADESNLLFSFPLLVSADHPTLSIAT